VRLIEPVWGRPQVSHQNRVVVALGERARRSNVSNEDLRSTEPVVDRKRVYRLYKPERLMVPSLKRAHRRN
jgi:hypothetical protein